MTPRTKYILKDAINVFKAVSSEEKIKLIATVQNNLNVHYNGLETIGVGLDEDKVKAGEIFLRIFKRQIMTAYILIGEQSIKAFEDEDWQYLEETILEDYSGDIIGWNKETDSIAELLEQLKGYDNFILLSTKDLNKIENKTKIEIDRLQVMKTTLEKLELIIKLFPQIKEDLENNENQNWEEILEVNKHEDILEVLMFCVDKQQLKTLIRELQIMKRQESVSMHYLLTFLIVIIIHFLIWNL